MSNISNSMINTKYLSQYKEGSTVQVAEIEGGKCARQKLLDLGIVPGARIDILQGIPNHPYILRIGGTRIMLGWGMVEKIVVY